MDKWNILNVVLTATIAIIALFTENVVLGIIAGAWYISDAIRNVR